MPLTLLVPDLFPPDGFPADWPDTPALNTLLARGRLERGASLTHEDWLLSAFTVQGQPVGALRQRATRREPEVDPAQRWLCADPIHLRIERDHLQCMPAGPWSLTQAEADALIASINAHLAQDNLVIEALTPCEWTLRVPADRAPATTPLWRMAGQSLFDHLPAPTGGLDWKALGNELQMLLHEHPVNVARMERGEPPVSGLWFWGGDALPADCELAPDVLYADDTLTRGLAAFAKSEYLPVPENGHQWRAAKGMSLIVCDGLSRAVRKHDPAAWHESLLALERDWFAPALKAVWQRHIPFIRAVFPGERATHYLHVSRLDLWKFWTRRRPAQSHA